MSRGAAVSARLRTPTDLQQLSLRQIPNQPKICRQKVIPRQFRQRSPSHVVKNPILQRPRKLAHHKELQIDRSAISVLAPNPRPPPPNSSRNSQLFVQLPSQRVFRALTRFNLPTGKLPLQTHRLVRLSLAD